MSKPKIKVATAPITENAGEGTVSEETKTEAAATAENAGEGSVSETQTTPQAKPAVKTGSDPKNRLVHLSKKGDKYTVTKEGTGFSFTGTERKAKEVFKHQINCSHN
jgi:hypothetical protein